MLSIKEKRIVDQNGQALTLKGIALGGWLMMEGYLLGGDNLPESQFKTKLLAQVGLETAQDFVWQFRRRFITPKDARWIAEQGFNCVRLPFNYRLLEETAPDGKPGMAFLKEAVSLFTSQKLYVILDMHAVPGAQNQDWHSDSNGTAGFFEKAAHRQKYLDLWAQLSREFKADSWVAGYDVMNEPVTEKIDLLTAAYAGVIKTIRSLGDNHLIFLEGNHWARQVDFILPLITDNIALSVHYYEPTQHVFHENGGCPYPGPVSGQEWNKKAVFNYLRQYAGLGAPVYVGEFGISSLCNNYQWVEDTLAALKELNFHWTYWTYKSVAGMNFPDGIFQHLNTNGFFGQRGGPQGMGMVARNLTNHPEQFYAELNTARFQLNRPLLKILKSAL